jgi:hypothetical protein
MPRKAVATESPNKLAPINIRTTASRRARIESLAWSSGRSLTQEIEHLLDFALDFETRFGGEELADSIALIGQAAGMVLRGNHLGLEHFKTRAQVVAAIKLAADWALPPAVTAASEDLDTIRRAVADLNLVLPQLIDHFDPDPLVRLGQGIPLNEETCTLYFNTLQLARCRSSADAGTVARIDELQSELSEAQRRANLVQQLIWEQSRLGESRALDALLKITRATSNTQEQ